jgi:hypothetical protein
MDIGCVCRDCIHSKRCKWVIAAILGTSLFALLTNDLYFANRRIAPPSVNCTLAELAAKVHEPRRLALVDQRGMQRLVWIGERPNFTVRSGLPCYVFDDRGRLVDWRAETGEGWSLDFLCSAACEAQPISLDEALCWCEQPRR